MSITHEVLARSTLGDVERWYQHGLVSQVDFEAYMHVWSTGAPRFSDTWRNWETPPQDPCVVHAVERIRALVPPPSPPRARPAWQVHARSGT